MNRLSNEAYENCYIAFIRLFCSNFQMDKNGSTKINSTPFERPSRIIRWDCNPPITFCKSFGLYCIQLVQETNSFSQYFSTTDNPKMLTNKTFTKTFGNRNGCLRFSGILACCGLPPTRIKKNHPYFVKKKPKRFKRTFKLVICSID